MTENKKYKSLEADELMKRMKNKEPLLLIDTLTGSHFEKVHLPGARSACVFEVTFLEQVEAIAESKKAEIVLYGSSGRSRDALTAADKLQREGYENISVLNGGLEAWRARGFELQGDQPGMADPETVLRLDDGQYRVDIDQSVIEWSGRNPNSKHFGTVGIKEGQVKVNSSILTGVVDIDMESIDNTNLKGDELHPVLTAHLKSDDFFFVKMFPSAVLTITEGVPVETPFLSTPNYGFKATLELRGVKADLAFQATVTKTEGGGLAAEAHFDIDRTRWEVIYGSARFFENLGMHLVFDLISFQVKIVTTEP
ncbi:MAG: YceI family protein [Desulfobacterales bacterium]|jgi:rhodanese-related sulfurtransferase